MNSKRLKNLTVFLLVLFLFSLSFNQSIAEEVLTWQDCVKEAAKNHPDLIHSAVPNPAFQGGVQEHRSVLTLSKPWALARRTSNGLISAEEKVRQSEAEKKIT